MKLRCSAPSVSLRSLRFETPWLFGRGEILRLTFTARPSNPQLTQRQRIRELLRLSRIADEHRAVEFRGPNQPRISRNARYRAAAREVAPPLAARTSFASWNPRCMTASGR